GMSDVLGPIAYREKDEMVFLGRELGEQKHYSEKVAAQIDAEVKHIIDTAYALAQSTIKKYRKKLDLLAEKLIKDETIEGAEYDALFPEVLKLKKSPAKKLKRKSRG
ncbi:MAG: hypothetical protein U1D32_02190, partial [Patescibacteria group bacterium]|nr:hypothetical protein [Patescibacteria group bacterium]